MRSTFDSRLPGFHKLSPEDRLATLARVRGLSEQEQELLSKLLVTASISESTWLENQVSGFVLPLSVAPNFVINNKPYIIPMVTDESGIVAACSFAAKAAAKQGGFVSRLQSDWVLGQIICNTEQNFEHCVEKLQSAKTELINYVNSKHSLLKKAGGGLRDIRAHTTASAKAGRYLTIDLVVDCADAMGALLVTTMAEELAPRVERLLDCKATLKAVSNDASGRLCECTGIFDPADLGGVEVAELIVHAYERALADQQRAITHNKGILNGMVTFASALCNDTRAIEASAHFHAVSSGAYCPLSEWRFDGDRLRGTLRVPVPMGYTGGSTRASQISKICFKILGAESGAEVRQICAAVGLAAHLGVLRALVSTGLGRTHPKKA